MALALCLVLGLVQVECSQAAAAPAPHLRISGAVTPSRIIPGDRPLNVPDYQFKVVNDGGAPTEENSPITIVNELPVGVHIAPGEEEFVGPPSLFYNPNEEAGTCEGEIGTRILTCTTDGRVLEPGYSMAINVPISVDPTIQGPAVDVIRTHGGGAPDASFALTTPVSSEPPGFEFELHDATTADAAGMAFTDAGGHPYQFDTSFELAFRRYGISHNRPVASMKEVTVTLPKGLVANPQATPRCTEHEFETPEDGNDVSSCPAASAVGIAYPTIGEFNMPAQTTASAPIYNLVPPPGVPAALGFNASGFGLYVHLLGHVDSAGDFVLSAKAKDVPTFGEVGGVAVELWGDPSDASHKYRRGECAYVAVREPHVCTMEKEGEGAPFLTMPTNCTAGPLSTTLDVSAWQPVEPITSTVNLENEPGVPIEVGGCNKLEFTPTISARPTTDRADSPTGLQFDLHQPQNESPEGLSTASLKDARVTLPEGVTVNAAAANGLGSCDESQIGYEPAEGKIRFSETPQSCPDAAKIGTLQVGTPLLGHKLPGSIYLAKPYQNPFGSLLAIYLAIEDEETGIVAKLAGKVEPDPTTGRLTATFTENPELPLEDVDLKFFEGPGAALKTPLACGAYATTSDLTPWSTPEGADAHPTGPFQTTVAAAGSGACPSSEAAAPNAPSFSAGTVTPQAGAFSPFVLELARADGTQRFAAIDTTLPAGLTGRLAGVPYCPENDIVLARDREAPNQGAVEQVEPSCPSSSQVGTVTVGAGAGSQPFHASGHVYLAGPYEGAPLSLVIVTPAVAGPFDLGAVVVRAALYINPNTAQVTVRSDPLPTILQGIPLDVRSVAITIDRSQFTLNPTSCEPMLIGGEAISAQNQTAALSDRFQVGGCQALPFKPSLKTSTQGKTSKANGAGLTVKVAQKPGEANIHKVDLTLPLALPARLTTLQQACTEAQFAANPAGCPAGSFIGTAKAVTPILAAPLVGPAILVSHGGAAFPDVVFLLQANERGGIIRIDLDGKTEIKKGITYSRFETVPDAPISSFETVLPEGPHSVLSANGDLCAGKLTIPTRLAAQNGATIDQNTSVAVEGCSTSLSFTSSIEKKTLKLSVYAPAAGKITARGRGLTAQTKTAKGQGRLTLTLHQKKAGRLKTSVRVVFTPSAGKERKKQSRSAKLTFRR